MSTFTDANCQVCSTLQFKSYTFTCNVLDADLQGLGFVICGSTLDCPTQEADYNTLIGNNQFIAIFGVAGTKADPTPVEVDTSAYSCLPSKFVKEYDEVLNWTVPFHPDNWQFWQQFRDDENLASEAMYVTKSGVNYVIPSSPSIFVAKSQENGIDVIAGSIEWTTKEIERPYAALTAIWAC